METHVQHVYEVVESHQSTHFVPKLLRSYNFYSAIAEGPEECVLNIPRMLANLVSGPSPQGPSYNDPNSPVGGALTNNKNKRPIFN